jgi:hypothetical protein
VRDFFSAKDGSQQTHQCKHQEQKREDQSRYCEGIEFVSFSEQLDTSTPAGKMVFTVLGAVAELERGLIVERVKAGLRKAKAKGKQLGRPKKILDTKRIAMLRAQGVGWKRIAAEMGVGSRNDLSCCPGGFQNSGKGFLNPAIRKVDCPRH